MQLFEALQRYSTRSGLHFLQIWLRVSSVAITVADDTESFRVFKREIIGEDASNVYSPSLGNENRD